MIGPSSLVDPHEPFPRPGPDVRLRRCHCRRGPRVRASPLTSDSLGRVPRAVRGRRRAPGFERALSDRGHGPRDGRHVALSFDDGPDPEVTPAVL